jgi:hypothetical protein
MRGMDLFPSNVRFLQEVPPHRTKKEGMHIRHRFLPRQKRDPLPSRALHAIGVLCELSLGRGVKMAIPA